jgi:hypothetical protein
MPRNNNLSDCERSRERPLLECVPDLRKCQDLDTRTQGILGGNVVQTYTRLGSTFKVSNPLDTILGGGANCAAACRWTEPQVAPETQGRSARKQRGITGNGRQGTAVNSSTSSDATNYAWKSESESQRKSTLWPILATKTVRLYYINRYGSTSRTPLKNLLVLSQLLSSSRWYVLT